MNVSAFENAYLSRINTIMQSEEINLHVARALTFVIQNVFANISNAFVLTLSSSGGATGFWLHDIMKKIFATFGGMIAVQLIIFDSKTLHVDVAGKHYCYMILIDSFESLKKTNIVEHNRNSDSLEHYFIFLQAQDKLLASEMEKTLKYCFDNYWIDCNIMAQNSRGEILVYTYFPFKENNCFKTEPELINRFVGNKFENDIMFPDKLSDLKGCPLKLSTWDIPPFVVNATNRRAPNLHATGCEIFAIVAIGDKMNFTVDVEWLAVETYDQNKSPETVPLSKLQSYDTNLTMGYFLRKADRDKIATPTFSTYYIPLVAIMIRKEAQHATMRIWTFPFDTPTWIMIVVAYIIIGRFNIFQSMNIKRSIFEVFEVIIGMPINNLPKGTSNRIHFMTAITSSFILRSIYQSLLFYIFRTNFYQAPPVTFDGLVKVAYTAVATEITSRFLLYVPQIQNKSLPLTVINGTSEMYPLRYLELHQNESLVAMTIVEFAIHYVSEELEADIKLQVLPINVKDQQICFYLPKHSFYSDRFSHYILHFHQAGLFDKWREWTIQDYRVLKVEATTASEGAFIVNLSQLVGFLFLVIFLFLTSITLFLIELMSKRYKCLQKLF